MQTNGFLTALLTKSHDCEVQVNISVFIQENVKSQNTCKNKKDESWNFLIKQTSSGAKASV